MLTSGSETLGTTGPAEHLQTGGINNVTGALTSMASEPTTCRGAR
jgi:hypothetical protein